MAIFKEKMLFHSNSIKLYYLNINNNIPCEICLKNNNTNISKGIGCEKYFIDIVEKLLNLLKKYFSIILTDISTIY